MLPPLVNLARVLLRVFRLSFWQYTLLDDAPSLTIATSLGLGSFIELDHVARGSLLRIGVEVVPSDVAPEAVYVAAASLDELLSLVRPEHEPPAQNNRALEA